MKKLQIATTSVLAAVLAASTVYEKLNPEASIYGSWWFVGILAAVGAVSVLAIVRRHLWKQPPLLLIHTSVLLMLAGGALTTWTGIHGSMTLQPGVPTAQFDADGSSNSLPFSITLEAFEVVPYSGTRSPMDFVSHVSCDGAQFDISMNRIMRHGGYRFYQEDYGDDGSSVLSVAHDPWGIGVTYCGYALLMAGLMWLMLAKEGPYRRLRQKGNGMARGVVMAAVVLAAFNSPLSALNAQPTTLPRAEADQMGRMYVLYKGRICPLQTMAKDFTTKLTGSATYKGLTPEQVLAGWMFYYDRWQDEPMIKVKGEARSTAGGRYVSMHQLAFLDTLTITPATDKNLRGANEKYNLVKMLSAGRLLKLFPVEDGWYGQNDQLPLSVDDSAYMFIRLWQSYCQELVTTGDWERLGYVFAKTTAFQMQHSDGCPEGTRLGAERLYNALTTGRWPAMLSITLGLLVFAFALVRQARGRGLPRWAFASAFIWTALLTLWLLLTMALRWIAGGHAPMAGGFDSMNLTAIVIGLVALILCRRHPTALSIGMMAMGFCLLVAMMSGSNPPVTNLMPVLNSPLLTLHVAVIMCSYALFFFVMLGGVAGLVVDASAYRRLNTVILYPAVTLLALGIIIGAVWANISWGTYWSWDPKETWALITLLLYALPLLDGARALRSDRAFCFYCTLAFLSVVVTYFGVNLILGGMHSYS